MTTHESSSIWTVERTRIHQRLQEVDEGSAAMYRYAIAILDEPARPGEAAARAALVGHCIRELVNPLPEALGDVDGVPMRGRTSEAEQSRLAVSVERAKLTDYKRDDSTTETEFVSVPSDLLQSAVALAADYRAGQGRRRGRDAAIVLGRIDPHDAALVPWTAARKFFMRPTHLGTKDPPTDEELFQHLATVEASLAARLGDFFANIDALTEILADANAPEEPR